VRDKGPPLLICDHRSLAIAAAATTSAASAAPGVTLLSHPFGPGLGCLYVAPDLISTAMHKEITQEIRTLGGCERFCTHFLLHAEAKMDTNTSSSADEFLIQQCLNQDTAMDVVHEA
jgi:hypothetical protein